MAFGLVFLFVVFVTGIVHQWNLPSDGMILISTRSTGYYWNKDRQFYVIEVVCKRKEQFVALPYSDHYTLEDETEEDVPMQDSGAGIVIIQNREETTYFPEQPAKYFWGIWQTRFYVVLHDDGKVHVFDTEPAPKLNSTAWKEVLKPYISLVPPQNPIIWQPTTTSGREYMAPGTGMGIAIGTDPSTRKRVSLVGVYGNALSNR